MEFREVVKQRRSVRSFAPVEVGEELIIMGGQTQEISPALAEWQVKSEKERPARKPFEEFATIV